MCDSQVIGCVTSHHFEDVAPPDQQPRLFEIEIEHGVALLAADH
jgi:hypothetical protein